MNRKNIRRGFTLTELAVVVIIIAILSAVVIPKFNKVFETYKTSEAEQMLEAIRSEQEMRCMLGKEYTTRTEELTSWTVDNSKNFKFELKEGGMTATRLTEEYELKIPSYADGRICCDGCESLNKDYLTCNELKAKPDYMPAGSCTAAPTPTPTPAPTPTPTPGKEPAEKKKYLSYAQSCIRYHSVDAHDHTKYALGCSTYSGSSRLKNQCFLVHAPVQQNYPSIVIGLPAGCTPGGECSSCTLGKKYVSTGQPYVYCDSSPAARGVGPETDGCTSVDVFTCIESATVPQGKGQNCQIVSSAVGGADRTLSQREL